MWEDVGDSALGKGTLSTNVLVLRREQVGLGQGTEKWWGDWISGNR